ncbi:hypothetical protein ACHAQH_005168 [Verticillium albo-atrum]
MPHPIGIKLVKVHTAPDTQVDVDIIAIHGLDTESAKTWVWTPKHGAPAVNWLSDPSMLPKTVKQADIWTCDWQAHLFSPPGQAPKRLEELARDLLATLEAHLRQRTIPSSAPCRQILFIASCFGGILLLKTIILSSREDSLLLKALSGIIFLATPFQGTSFKRLATWAKPILALWAKSRHQEPTPLLALLEEASPEIDTLVRDFTRLWKHQISKCQVFTFYELRNTNLLSKVKLDYFGTDEPVSYFIQF